MYPTKVIASSEDNSVRMFSSCGKQLNLQILPEDDLHVVAAVLSGNKSRRFVCFCILFYNYNLGISSNFFLYIRTAVYYYTENW